jgi:hypothetical protein
VEAGEGAGVKEGRFGRTAFEDTLRDLSQMYTNVPHQSHVTSLTFDTAYSKFPVVTVRSSDFNTEMQYTGTINHCFIRGSHAKTMKTHHETLII